MSFKSILHPTDFSEQSMAAFNHALKMALVSKSELIIMYSMQDRTDHLDWDKFPKVRETLHRWGLIDKNASRKDIHAKFGVKIKKVIGKGENIVDSVVGILSREYVDLIVMSTHGKMGISNFVNLSISESIARKAFIPTLFIPYNSKQFVSAEKGTVNLKNILVPVDHKPKPQRAVEFGINMGRIYGENSSTVHIMHVVDKNILSDEKKKMPELDLPEGEDCILRFENKQNSIQEEIQRVADEIDADLLVLATEGRTGLLDILKGSTGERVLHNSNIPVLTVPAPHGDYLPRDY